MQEEFCARDRPICNARSTFSANYRQFLERWLTNQGLPLLLGKQEVKRSDAVLEQYVPMPH